MQIEALIVAGVEEDNMTKFMEESKPKIQTSFYSEGKQYILWIKSL